MARGNFGTIRTATTLEKKLLIDLVAALVAVSTSWAWCDSINWTIGTVWGSILSSPPTLILRNGFSCVPASNIRHRADRIGAS